MPKSRIILALGFFIALLPVLGFPNSWDHFFDTASGLLIVLLSVLISVDRRLTLKAKAEKRSQRKRAIVTPHVEEVAAVESAPVVHYGRRASDRKVPVFDADMSDANAVPRDEGVVEGVDIVDTTEL